MELSEGSAHGCAAADAGISPADALEKCHHCRWPPCELAKRPALAIFDRLWATQSARRQMLHKPEKKGQVTLFDPFFIKRKDEMAAFRVQKKV